ncbi:HpcH/HpaI aldolase/citrate lyase family protein [Paraurantiacibacter namhicola]|uniref:(3S)-malyl-CoA thioesterase n=1 Tax=Paraurantiacibacter namhicola TaxID=645517 RepID=A0A1C7D4Y9_9SPHN|nr:CoA ester lyase [Paraurantiacibacter namhicola]ANU06373.1 (3S)-malyl-CoA thioesterase [Paraurantiacibacter namhicola]
MFSHSSLLFVPGSRPDRFAKARAAKAGLTVIDLEDAVPADGKDAAREAALEAIAEDPAAYALRINPPTTPAGIADLYHLARAGTLPEVMLVPMVQSEGELAVVRGALGDTCPALVPLVETPRGLRRARAIASSPGVAALMFGGGDFSGELGVELAWEPLLLARQQIVLACAEAGVPAVDVPFIQLDDEDGLAAECGRVRALGFAAKAAIHPRQVAAIETAFAPTSADIEEARRAIAAFEGAGGKAIRHEGRMLEAPLVKHYRAVLAREGSDAHA